MKQPLRYLLTATLLAPLLSGCGSNDQPADAPTEATANTETTVASPEVAAETAPAETAPAQPAAGETAATPGGAFNISTIPVSTASLGGFPYVSGPKGYKFPNPSDSAYYEFDRSYVYDGQQLVPIEGKVLRRQYRVINNNKKTSELMQQRNYETLIKSLGGVQVSSGELPREAVEKIGRDTYKKYTGNIDAGDQVDTYVIRQKDKEVWIQVKPGETYMNINVTERAAMPQQVSTVPAGELKKN
ncbi:hypothetical protein [Hymenobacter rubripertinctus]|uniref:Uncharacterized protein n=1 Tax=Hymenobacter rubripertinctus TaxID=2029981 RepID=A0A418QYJ7_9BACT|nr:hypothetical protein [Hymenobacter rubripertinctus]RIY10232.1 hypothetical protein D0T11_10290 [Hymenobacter rubripertinctus]